MEGDKMSFRLWHLNLFCLGLMLVSACGHQLAFLEPQKPAGSEKTVQAPILSSHQPENVKISPVPIERYKQLFYICETKYFKLYFVKKDAELALKAAKDVDAVYEKHVDWYQHQLVTPYEIYFLPDKRTIYRMTGETRDMGGFVTSKRGTFFIASQHYNLHIIAHELSHVFLRKKVRERKVPIWFNEGLAEYLSTPKADSEYVRNFVFKKVGSFDELFTWREMERNIMLKDSRKTYSEALSIILFLNEKYGREKLKEVLNLYADSNYHQSFVAAMNQVYGKSKNDLEGEWLDFIKGFR